MTIEEAIAGHLNSQAGITALVGAAIYQGEREQGSALPAISFDLQQAMSYQDMTAGSVGVGRATYRFHCYAATTKQAAAIREMVRLAFQNHINAPMGIAPGLKVWCCLFVTYGEAQDGETLECERSVDFEFLYQQPTT